MVTKSTLVSFIIALALFGSEPVVSVELYFVDAYSEVDETVNDLELIIKNMERDGVASTVLASRKKRTSRDIVKLSQKYPNKIIPAVRVHTSSFIKNERKFYKMLRQQIHSGKFRAMGRISLYHAEKPEANVSEVRIYPEEPQVQALIKAAIRNGWPVILKIEFRETMGPMKTRYMRGLTDMLTAHREHNFVLEEFGQLAMTELRQLINSHNNIYFLTSHSNPAVSYAVGQSSWINIFDGEAFKPDWRELFIKYPNRFIFSLGNGWDFHWRDDYPQQMQYWRKAMADLPENVAAAIAHGNAERLWNLPKLQ